MPKTVLLLRLEGPLQSWGARSRWDVRDTQPEPTKSGIVGLLGCALGYGMYDPRLEELDAALRMGVRVEQPGRIGEDYQTITDYLPTAQGSYKHTGVKTASSLERLRADDDAIPATIISPRSYLEDARFLVALESADGDEILENCAKALRNPQWPAFLGRKCCIPTRPVFESLTDEFDGAEDALTRYQLTERKTVWIESDTAGDGAERQDAMRVNRAREYGFRRVHRRVVSPAADKEEGA